MNARPRSLVPAAWLGIVACTTHVASEPPAETKPAAVPAAPPTAAAPAPAVELPFDPSPNDKPSLGHTGFVGVGQVPADTGFVKGPKIHGVKPGAGLEKAGLAEGDVIVKFADATFGDTDDPIGAFRKRLDELPPDSETTLSYWRKDAGVREVAVRLGRRPPPFASLDTPAEWFESPADADLTLLVAEALALDSGQDRYADVLARQRKHLGKRDALRLKLTTQAHMELAANEALARKLTEGVAEWAENAAVVAAPDAAARVETAGDKLFESLDLDTLGGCVAAAERLVVDLDQRCRAATSMWTPDERAFVGKQFHELTERVNEGEYLYDDPEIARERTNRRLIKLFAQVDRGDVAVFAAQAEKRLVELVPKMAAAVKAKGGTGLLVSKKTAAGDVEIWGGGDTRHVNRAAFCFDVGGDDDWLDCAGRADLDRPVSIAIDWTGDDLYGGTSDFNQGGALGGVGVLIDHEGDDQYLARTWSQGCGVCGFGMLDDEGGRDVYHGQEECQGVGLAGAGVLIDDVGDDLYTGARFCQGVGFAGGVGAVIEQGGDDRYVCTGRYGSEYGEPGLFSGWGQGVGFGFRGVASGGIGLLFDMAGKDVYEAGNFSQGGGYFYGWGILRDDAGDDRYIGSRYAQGFAAHQAVGTFLEGGGNDRYQSHSNVGNGISWDETSVVFHDLAGNDVYERSDPWLAGAAQNGMVLFLDDAGDDRYEAVPAHARSNEYHGGRSFALFVDRGGKDTYGLEKPEDWNDRAMTREEGAYFLDLPPSPKAFRDYLR
jgi:hypothetical protein